MRQKKIILKRNELYEKVWKIPMTKLANKYGISDVGLKKICKKLNVPTPPRGYWARAENGHDVKKVPLPKAKAGTPREHVHIKQNLDNDGYNGKPLNLSKYSLEARHLIRKYEAIAAESQRGERSDPEHKLVRATRKALRNSWLDNRYGVLHPFDENCLHVRVAPNSVDRALLILDSFIKAFEKIGIPVETEKNKSARHPTSYFVMFGREVPFWLTERTSQSEEFNIEAQGVNKKIKQNSYEHFPTGELTLEFLPYMAKGYKRRWTDTSNKRLEDCIDEIIVGAIMIADHHNKKFAGHEAQERFFLEEQRKGNMFKKRVKLLESQADNFHKSQMLNQYIDEVDKKFRNKLSVDMEKQLNRWLDFARRYAADINPLNHGHPFIVDDDHENKSNFEKPKRLEF